MGDHPGSPFGCWRAAVVAALAVAAVCTSPVRAQPDQPPADTPRAASRDFWFGAPRGWFGARGSWVLAREGSDVFDFIQDQLTIDAGDFNAPAWALDFGFTVAERLDVVVGFERGQATVSSEYRDYVDNNFRPIEQETRLTQTSITGSLRYAVTARGRRISRYAWIPAAFTPYVGAGGGVMLYSFKQSGDFVDFEDLSVFPYTFEASGPAPTAHVFVGTDLQAYRRLFFTLEGRYVWASGDMSDEFVDFDPIDLAGFRLSGGISVVF